MYNEDWGDEDDYAGNIEQLLREYELMKNGESVRYWDEQEFEIIVDYFYQNNREAEALTACEFALLQHPFSTEFLILKAELLFQAHKYRQAIKSLDELESREFNSLEATILRSDILVAQYKFDEAATLLEERKNLFEGKEKMDLMLELAEIYDECEKYDEVFYTFEKILKLDPRNEEALHKISFWADFADKHEESITLHQELIDEDPYNALAWFNLGAAYQGLKFWEKAIDAYEFCVAIDETFEIAYRNMADAYIRLRWYDKAIETLKKNLELGKPEDVIYEAIGHCFEKKKNFDTARYYYIEATKLNPSDHTVYYKIGKTYAVQEDWAKALVAFSRAYELDNKNPEYPLAIGNCLIAQDELMEAIACFLNAIKLKPNNRKYWLALVKALYMIQAFEDAKFTLEEGVEVCGEHADFDYYEAAILFSLGKTKQAMIKLEDGLAKSVRKLKTLLDVAPELLQRKSVVDVIAKYKKKK